MAKYIKSREEVEDFLGVINNLIEVDGIIQINNQPWKGKENKTLRYMAETGIKKKDIIKVIQELEVQNYSSTKDEANPNFAGEKVWEFGITKNMVDRDEKLYIKLKVRKLADEILVIMSFHPEEPKDKDSILTFPYK